MGNIFDLANGKTSIVRETPRSKFVLDQDNLRNNPDIVNRKLSIETINSLNAVNSYKSFGIIISSIQTPFPTTTYNSLMKQNTTSAPSIFTEYRVKILDKNVDNLSTFMNTGKDLLLGMSYKVCAASTTIGQAPIADGTLVRLDYDNNVREEPIIVEVFGVQSQVAPNAPPSTAATQAFASGGAITNIPVIPSGPASGNIIIGGVAKPAPFKIKNYMQDGIPKISPRPAPNPSIVKKLDKLVIHETGGTGLLSTVTTLEQKGASVQLLLDIDGTFYQIDDLLNISYHGSSPGANYSSVGIEVISPSAVFAYGTDFSKKGRFAGRPILVNTNWNGGKYYLLPFAEQFEAIYQFTNWLLTTAKNYSPKINVPAQFGALIDISGKKKFFLLGTPKPGNNPRGSIISNLSDRTDRVNNPSAPGIHFHQQYEHHYDGALLTLYTYFRLNGDDATTALNRCIFSGTDYNLNSGIDLDDIKKANLTSLGTKIRSSSDGLIGGKKK